MIRHLPDLLIGVAILCGVAFLFGAGPVRAAECGKASWYGGAHHGKTMANGRPFNMHAMTAASNSLPLGSKARVTYGKKSVVVTISDTGGFGKYGRIIDMSKGAFAKLAHTDKGIIRVCVERL
jgi:rare lipoprotein A